MCNRIHKKLRARINTRYRRFLVSWSILTWFWSIPDECLIAVCWILLGSCLVPVTSRLMKQENSNFLAQCEFELTTSIVFKWRAWRFSLKPLNLYSDFTDVIFVNVLRQSVIYVYPKWPMYLFSKFIVLQEWI